MKPNDTPPSLQLHKHFTQVNGTWTHDGFFPHRLVQTDDFSCMAPVCVVPFRARTELPTPAYARDGHVFYAMPGGVRVEVPIH